VTEAKVRARGKEKKSKILEGKKKGRITAEGGRLWRKEKKLQGGAMAKGASKL